MSTQIRTKPNWRSLALMSLALAAAVVVVIGPVQAQGNIKSDFLAAVRKRMETTNRGSGLSSQFFSVGDPNKMLPEVDSYLNGVAVDPKYLSSYKWKQFTGFDNATEGGLMQPRDWSQTWTNVVTPQEGRYDGWIILAQAPTASDEAIKTAFHEAIHAYHLAIGAGDVDADSYGCPETISNNFSNIVFKLRKMDSKIDRILQLISKGQEYEIELGIVRKGLANDKTEMNGYLSQFYTCLDNIGGKADWAGFEQLLEKRIKKEIEQAEKLNRGRKREIVLLAKPTVTEQKGGNKQTFLFDLQYRVNGLSNGETALINEIVSLDGPSRPDIPQRTRKVRFTDLKVQDLWAWSDLKPGDYNVRYLLHWPGAGQVSGVVPFKVIAKGAQTSGVFRQTGVVLAKAPGPSENGNAKYYGSISATSYSVTVEAKGYEAKTTVNHTYTTPPATLKPGDIITLSCASTATISGGRDKNGGLNAPHIGSSCGWELGGKVTILKVGRRVDSETEKGKVSEENKGTFAGVASNGILYPTSVFTVKFQVLPGTKDDTIILRAWQSGQSWGNEVGNPAEYKYTYNP